MPGMTHFLWLYGPLLQSQNEFIDPAACSKIKIYNQDQKSQPT